ncbi:hypothetical protein AVDCRST_MAG81-2741, partial [uncultured Synechococcales cyanobacterium]
GWCRAASLGYIRWLPEPEGKQVSAFLPENQPIYFAKL